MKSGPIGGEVRKGGSDDALGPVYTGKKNIFPFPLLRFRNIAVKTDSL